MKATTKYVAASAVAVLLGALLVWLWVSSREKAIVGYWQWGEVQSFWEFRADGTCQTHGGGASPVNGYYKFLNRDELQIELADDVNPMVVLVSIKGDEMTFSEHQLGVKLHRVGASAIPPEEGLR